MSHTTDKTDGQMPPLMEKLYNHLRQTANEDSGPPPKAIVVTTMSKLAAAIDLPRATCYFLIGKLKELGLIATEKHRTGHVGAAGTKITLLCDTKPKPQPAPQQTEECVQAEAIENTPIVAVEMRNSRPAAIQTISQPTGLIQSRLEELLQNPNVIYQVRSKSGVYDDAYIRENAFEFANQLELQGKDESGISLALHYGYWLGIKAREQQKRSRYENINDQERRRSAETQQWCNAGMSGSIQLFGADDKPIPF